MTFKEAIIKVLTDSENKPLSARQIYDRIVEEKLIDFEPRKGKTPYLSINTILHREPEIFELVDGNPHKFIYRKYVSKTIKSALVENGFLTVERLLEILQKNNIKIEL